LANPGSPAQGAFLVDSRSPPQVYAEVVVWGFKYERSVVSLQLESSEGRLLSDLYIMLSGPPSSDVSVVSSEGYVLVTRLDEVDGEEKDT
jgi:hypothetical protein